jgi:hypothetical protein
MERADVFGPVHLVGLVDWDPAGAALSAAYAGQLSAFGLEVGSVRTVVRPELLDADSRALLSRPLAGRTLTKRWLAATGGVEGQARGLSAEAVPAVTVKTLVNGLIEELAPEAALWALAEQDVTVAAWRGRVGGRSTVPVVAMAPLAEAAPRAMAHVTAGGRAVVATGSVATAMVCPLVEDLA